MMVSTKQVFLVTGGNSGIGLECSRALAKLANTHVIVAGRNKQRIDEAVADIRRTASSSSVVEAGIFDLSSLKSVRAYADSLIQRDLHFFSVICNAGLQTKKQSTTADGFELTIGTNHIGHFLLVKLLIDRTKRVINLTSETHDPAETKGTGIPPPNMSNLDLLAKGYPKYDMMQIYATSKLCTLLHALEIVRRYPGGPEVIAYSPGLTPDTGLFREHSKLVVPILKFFLKIIFWIRGERMSTSLYSGAYWRVLQRLTRSAPRAGKPVTTSASIASSRHRNKRVIQSSRRRFGKSRKNGCVLLPTNMRWSSTSFCSLHEPSRF